MFCIYFALHAQLSQRVIGLLWEMGKIDAPEGSDTSMQAVI